MGLTPFAAMDARNRPRIHWATAPRGFWSEMEDGLRWIARTARDRGIATVLKPHLWLDQSWPGAVEMESEESWRAWFTDYRSFVLRWARFAREEGIEVLCIGSELDRTLRHESDWRALIAAVRAEYGGALIYAANWSQVEQVPFWDALDAIGVNAYYPLSSAASPTVDELVSAWLPIRARLARLARRWSRPLVFTEIGYHPREHAFAQPWRWEVGRTGQVPECQARGYEAVARVFYDQPWFGGVFWWQWPTLLPRAERERWPPPAAPLGSTYSPRGLPAEDVLRRTLGTRRAKS